MKPQNRLDPITLEPPTPPIFFFVQETDILYRYSAANLVGYIEDSGDLRDPLSQIKYSAVELHRLEKLCGKKIVISPTRNEDKNNRDIVMFLENDIGNHYTDVFSDFEAIDISGSVSLYDSDNWSMVMQILNEIRNVSLWHCNSVIQHLKEKIKLEKYRNDLNLIKNEVANGLDDLLNYVSYINDEEHSMESHINIYLEALEIRKNYHIFKEMMLDVGAFERRINMSTETFYLRSRAIVRRLRNGQEMRYNPMHIGRRGPGPSPIGSPRQAIHHPSINSSQPNSIPTGLIYSSRPYQTGNNSQDIESPLPESPPRIILPMTDSPNSQSTSETVHSSDEEKEDILDFILPPISPIRNPINRHIPSRGRPPT